MNRLIGFALIALTGCALRLGPIEGGPRTSQGTYPPPRGEHEIVCTPCIEIAERYAFGLMWFSGWPLLLADLR